MGDNPNLSVLRGNANQPGQSRKQIRVKTGLGFIQNHEARGSRSQQCGGPQQVPQQRDEADIGKKTDPRIAPSVMGDTWTMTLVVVRTNVETEVGMRHSKEEADTIGLAKCLGRLRAELQFAEWPFPKLSPKSEFGEFQRNTIPVSADLVIAPWWDWRVHSMSSLTNYP
jgi:hypothetical protein